MRGRSLAARVFFTPGSTKNCRPPLDFGKFYPVYGVFPPVPPQDTGVRIVGPQIAFMEINFKQIGQITGPRQRFS